jgi:predicted phage tail protein
MFALTSRRRTRRLSLASQRKQSIRRKSRPSIIGDPNQRPSLTRQQILEAKYQQAIRAEQRKRKNLKEGLVKVFSFVGTIFLFSGIGLIIYGALQAQTFGYVAGSIMIVAGIVFLSIMITIMCKTITKQNAADCKDIELQSSRPSIVQVMSTNKRLSISQIEPINSDMQPRRFSMAPNEPTINEKMVPNGINDLLSRRMSIFEVNEPVSQSPSQFMSRRNSIAQVNEPVVTTSGQLEARTELRRMSIFEEEEPKEFKQKRSPSITAIMGANGHEMLSKRMSIVDNEPVINELNPMRLSLTQIEPSVQ